MGVALVTGASSGLGREFAEQLAGRGHDLVLVARHPERLQQAAAELRDRHDVAVETLTADLVDRGQLQRVADRLVDPDRPVDLLVNNAGFGSGRGFVRNDLAEEEAAVDLMVRAVMVLSHAAGRAMRGRGRGAILNVSSVASFAVMGHYSAIKAYVTVFSEALACELAPHGVTVTAVCPGFVHTEFHQRAEMDMSRLPEALWLDAPAVVREALAAVSHGKVVSVPSLTYKGVVGLLRVVPRRITRGVSGSLATRRRGRDPDRLSRALPSLP
ncbi:SDR family NAD(P)-dependent oxidoreductase [Ornithinimicrobium avium]|uniref:SDR family NAD(P)-dependent oxidoreductase n=1 Tax=Ornithinimicrobium avium TaxID=2283195 RepID=A0A345NPX8_9MICO|nr:SDR family oxidoreductase [Ornithinimicrobium avium]AXH97086.1 SDR family NAD(P)-dependent oxidoreductase [Ornithinimicrobium avium]